MYVLLGAMGLFVLMGLFTTRFGAAQRAGGLVIAIAMAALFLFVEGTY